MNQMSKQDLQQHVTILGWLHIIGHALFLIIGLFIFTLLTGIGAFSGDPEANRSRNRRQKLMGKRRRRGSSHRRKAAQAQP